MLYEYVGRQDHQPHQEAGGRQVPCGQDLTITPGILLRPMYAALDEIIKICGNRRIYILTPLPRYILVPCCEDDGHCINLVVKDDVTRQGVFDLMDELEMIGKAVSIKFSSCTVINTGDLLARKTGA